MRLGRRERKVVTVGVVLAAIFMLYFLVAEPLVQRQRRVRNEITAKSLLLGKYHSVLSRRRALEGESDKLKSRLANLESKLLQSDKPPLAAAELQKILKSAAAKAKVNISSERILEPVVRGHYIEIPVEIKVRCSVTRFASLLFAIENSAKHLSIRELNIKTDHKISPKEINVTLAVSGLIRNITSSDREDASGKQI